MISKVSIRNFKCLRDVQIDLERFAALVGPNGSGKSSILHALDLLSLSFRGHEQNVDRVLYGSASRGSDDAVELAAEFNGNGYRFRTLAPSGMPGRSWLENGLASGPDLEPADWNPWASGKDDPAPLPRHVRLRLEATKLADPVVSSDPTAMAPDGTGVHSALANMALNDPDAWQALQANLRRIIPSIRRLRHTRAAQQQPVALLIDTVGADSLLAHQVSEGTLLVIGLLAALHASGRPSLVMVDDLDRGLHPKAQKELIALLRSLLETNPDLQILATTHSPYMLDCMEPNEVRMTVLRDDGSTVCAPLAKHPKFEKWKDEMAPGEMWSLFGEKWLIEQEAAS